MTLEEYIKLAKEEIDAFYKTYMGGHKEDPEGWPLEMDEYEWGEQELAARFQ